jgi:molybdopterin-containing oxidoreductase family iron-sulfur binding subunit
LGGRCGAEQGREAGADERLDLARVRERLTASSGRDYWRSLDELSETPSFVELLHREFPSRASEFTDPVGRRRFLQLMGASLALAGVGACTKQPPEAIVPYVRQPEEMIPGRPRFFATAHSLSGYATGVLVESHLGRPTKIEGNPDHRSSLGATDTFAQASVLTLYDPDRSQTLTHLGEIRPWSALLGAVRAALAVNPRGTGLRILTESIGSPTLAGQLRQLLASLPDARWHAFEPAGRGHVRAGLRQAFGADLEARYHVDRADVIVALDSDFLGSGPGCLRHARHFAARRRPAAGAPRMNRLYAAEAMPTPTGSRADHRLPLKSSLITLLARAIAAGCGVGQVGEPTGLSEEARRFAEAVAHDLAAHRGSSLVVAGFPQPPIVHALAAAINDALDNTGRTVTYSDPVTFEPSEHSASIGELAATMDAGRVTTLLILGGNPVVTAPADLAFADCLAKVGLRIHVGLYPDETSALCHWHVPEAHYLESWSDARADDGTVTIVQPLIAPLYNGRSAHEVIAAFTDRPERSGHDLVREHWRRQMPSLTDPAFDKAWRQILHDGVVAATALPERPVTLLAGATEAAPASAGPTEGVEINFRPDPTIHDGRFANNGWLQELPKPLTSLTWENAAMVSAATAERLGLASEDLVRLDYAGRSVEAPLWIVPGHADDSVTVHLGYGRTRAGRVGNGAGFDAYRLRTSAAPWFGGGAHFARTGRRHPLAVVQRHHSMEGRRIVRTATLAEYAEHPDFAQDHHEGELPTLYPAHPYPGQAWGMAIDLNSCTGCNACVVACQAENNIPVVGKEQVALGREMHWLRVDTYHRGGLENPETYHQPVPCMHCENAPCEVVCPVGATVHSHEGLNDMVYNRCVGTRYCSNNCPYKVRRFNFLLYQDWTTPSLQLQRNPDVSVRSRGVMEKCTYCVQRINEARIDSERQGRPIRDGEVVTACEAVCPAQAIVFGDVNDPTSRVARLKADERNYALLGELNTRPRTTYLGALRNPNPALEPARPRATGEDD